MIRTLFLLLAWFVAVPAFSQGKPTSSSTQEQLLELRLEQQHLKEKLDDQKASLEEKFEVRKENLEYKSTRVGWWLSILALVLTVLPALGIFFGWKAYADIKKQRDKILDEQRDWNRKLTRIVYDKIKGLEEDAKEKLSKIVSEAKIELQKIKEMRVADELISTVSAASLSVTIEGKSGEQSGKEENVKFDFSQQADQINKSEYATPFQKALAKALELFFVNRHEDSIKQHLLILEEYKSELTLEQLPDFYFRLAYSYSVLKDHDNTIMYYEKGLNLNKYNAFAWNNLGGAYASKKVYDTAIAKFNEAVKQMPHFAEAWNNLGVTYNCKEDYDSAIVKYNEAIRLKPDYADAWYNLGITYGNMGDYGTAIRTYNHALSLNPGFVAALANLTELLIIQNEKAEETLSKLKAVEKTKVDEFNTLLLETIWEVKSKPFNGKADDEFELLKQDVNGDVSKVTWDFKILKEWLAREETNPLAPDKDTKEFVTELIRQIEEWRGSQPKAE